MKSWLSKRFASKVSSQTSRDGLRDSSLPADQILDLPSQIERISFEFSKTHPEKYSLSLTPFLSAVTPSHLVLSDGSNLLFFNLESNSSTQKNYNTEITFIFFNFESNSLLVSGSQVLKISLSSFEIIEILPIQTSFIFQSKNKKICIIDGKVSTFEEFPKTLYQHEEAFMLDSNEDFLVSLSPRLLLVFNEKIVFRYEKFSTDANFLKVTSSFLAVSGEFYCVFLVKLETWQTFNVFEQLANDRFTWLDMREDYLIAASGCSVLMQDLSFNFESWVLNTGSAKVKLAGFLTESSCYSCNDLQLMIFPSFDGKERLDRARVEVMQSVKGCTLFQGAIIAFSQSEVWKINENDLNVKLLIHSDLKSEIFVVLGGKDYLYISQKEGIFLFKDFTLAKHLEFSGNAGKLAEINENLMVFLKNSVQVVSVEDGKVLQELSYFSASPTAFDILDKQVFIGDSEGGIKVWNVDSGSVEKSLHKHKRKLKSLSVNPELSLLLSADGSSSVKIWSLFTFECFFSLYSNNCSQVLSFQSYSFTLSEKKTIKIFDLNDFSLITSVETRSKTKWILPFSSKILAINRNSFLFLNNPVLTKEIQVFGVSPEMIPILKRRLHKCLNGGGLKKVENFKEVLISPYNLNLFILSAYFNSRELMESQVNSTSLRPTTGGETFISICLSQDFIDLTTFLIRCLKVKIVNNPFCLFYLESSILELNKRSVPGLPQLYKLALGKSIRKDLPRFCIEGKNLPVTLISNSFFTVPSEFMQISEYSSVGKAITFSHTFIKINNTLGSSESIEFLDSLLNCSNSKVFKTGFIQLILNEKWKKVKIVILSQGVIYAGLIILLAFFVTIRRDQHFLLAPFLVSKVLMAYESYQLFVGPSEYLTDIWNLVDFSRAVLFLTYSAWFWAGHDSDELLAVTVFLTWSRGITYFRLFSGTRYYINLLFEVIRDMASFFVIFFYSVVGFAMVFFVLAQDSGYFKFLTSTYTLNFGNMETGDYDKLEWLLFLIVTVFNPIIMLNLLISIMGDTFERVKSNFETADLIELCTLIKEVELLVFWKRGERTRGYLHVCDEERTADKSMESDKYLKDINRTLKELTSLMKTGHETVTRGLSNSQVLFSNLNNNISEIKSKIQRR